MPRTCTVCTHADRATIDRAIVQDTAYRVIARQYGLDHDAVRRHADNHLPAMLAKAQAARDVAHADHLLREANRLYATATGIMDAAQAQSDHELTLKAIGTAGRMLGLLGELLGELNRQPQINLLVAPEWLTVRAALLAALAPFPEARAAVAERLIALEAGHAGN